jgi:hypothetical protein
MLSEPWQGFFQHDLAPLPARAATLPSGGGDDRRPFRSVGRGFEGIFDGWRALREDA